MLGICDQAHAVESLPPIPQLPAMPTANSSLPQAELGWLGVLLYLLSQVFSVLSAQTANYDIAICTYHNRIDTRPGGTRISSRIVDATDMSQRTELDKTVGRSRAFLQTVIDAIPDVLLVIDANYGIVLATGPPAKWPAVSTRRRD